jgi:hypothetical protein
LVLGTVSDVTQSQAIEEALENWQPFSLDFDKATVGMDNGPMMFAVLRRDFVC